MQQQMRFLEMAAPVWASLDDEQRSEVVAVLARLIVQAVAGRIETVEAVTADEETEDE